MIYNIKEKKTDSLFLSLQKPHHTWNNFLSDETIETLTSIEDHLSKLHSDLSSITPTPEKVLRFLAVPFYSIRVIILGQDPYPQAGVATGRAFEVADLSSWSQTFRNPSLKNIIRAIYKAYSNRIKTYSEIKAEIGQSLLIPSPTQAFREWEKQGVLFLNTAFTCTIDSPNSHRLVWHPFTAKLLTFIAESLPEAIWFLWGKNALEITEGLNIENVIYSYHPSRCQPRNLDFLYGDKNCFAETKQLINWAKFIEPSGLWC